MIHPPGSELLLSKAEVTAVTKVSQDQLEGGPVCWRRPEVLL